jgi:hypothetical protein
MGHQASICASAQSRTGSAGSVRKTGVADPGHCQRPITPQFEPIWAALLFNQRIIGRPSACGNAHENLMRAPSRSSNFAVLDAVTRVPDRRDWHGKTHAARAPRRWLVGFLLLHIACQLLLLVPQLSSVRTAVRMAAFGVSLAFLVIIPSKRITRTPLSTCALCILATLGLEFFHPEGGGLLGGLAAIMMKLAVLAPIFWVPRTETTATHFQALITILWLYYTASAVLGVLQAYFPGEFQPPLSAVIAARGNLRLAGLEIELASGERTFRPMGLTDLPGGAASAGLYAVLLGTGMLLSARPPFRGARVSAVGGMVAGMMCLYLCQIRSLVVMAGVCTLTLLAVLLISGQISKLVGLLGAVGVIVPGAFALALAIGGKSMTARLTTLVESDPGSVYYVHRGLFLEHTLTHDLPLYPLGAGLGRWGMVYKYFGDSAPGLWAEIQWTAWLYDGGVALILLYLTAILIASWGCLKIARRQDSEGQHSLSLWAAVIFAYNVGALAVCFNFPLFDGTGGVEFWLLNMAVSCAAQNTERGVFRAKLV